MKSEGAKYGRAGLSAAGSPRYATAMIGALEAKRIQAFQAGDVSCTLPPDTRQRQGALFVPTPTITSVAPCESSELRTDTEDLAFLATASRQAFSSAALPVRTPVFAVVVAGVDGIVAAAGLPASLAGDGVGAGATVCAVVRQLVADTIFTEL